MKLLHLELPDHPDLASKTLAMLSEIERHDGVAALSEQFVLGLRDGSLGHRHMLALIDDTPVAVAAQADHQAEFAVASGFRRRGIGTELLLALFDDGVTDVWAHGDLAGAQRLAAREGLKTTRELLVMAIEGEDLQRAAQVQLPQGFRAASLESTDLEQPEDAWLKVNNEAFSWHPEQGGWDRERLNKAMETEWFRADDVLLLEHEDSLAGFHWVKRHGELRDGAEGEIYVVGLGEQFRGQGLGDPLVRMGLERLYSEGAQKVILYVEADNSPAVKAYERLGFHTVERHVVYSRAASA